MLNIVALSVIVATLLVVLVGVVVMIIGGKTNEKYGNHLMIIRVVFQALALLLLYIIASK